MCNPLAGADDKVRADPADGEPGKGAREEDIRDNHGRRRYISPPTFCFLFIPFFKISIDKSYVPHFLPCANSSLRFIQSAAVVSEGVEERGCLRQRRRRHQRQRRRRREEHQGEDGQEGRHHEVS